MVTSRVEAVAELRAAATRALALCRRQARRPFILELAGTPKAGKTTSLGILKDFLKEEGFRVSVMRERAAECPIPMKGHFFFNAWTTATMLAQVIAQLDTACDILLLDRGFFAALVWLELQHQRGQVDDREKQVFEDFVLLERWQRLTDLTVLLTADASVAMARENHGRILERRGSIMEPGFLGTYNDILSTVARRHEDRFNVLTVDSSGSADPVGSGIALLEQILPRIESWADPEIVALPIAVVRAAFGEREWLDEDASRSFLADPAGHVVRRQRSELERDDSYVQLVASAAFRHDGKFVLIERSPGDAKYREFGTHRLWHRCHVEAGRASLLENAERQLEQRIRDDLHLSRVGDLSLCGTIWSDKERERKHLGITFLSAIGDPEIADSLSTKEFRRGERAHLLRTELYDLDELSERSELETWSRVAVSGLFKE